MHTGLHCVRLIAYPEITGVSAAPSNFAIDKGKLIKLLGESEEN